MDTSDSDGVSSIDWRLVTLVEYDETTKLPIFRASIYRPIHVLLISQIVFCKKGLWTTVYVFVYISSNIPCYFQRSSMDTVWIAGNSYMENS